MSKITTENKKKKAKKAQQENPETSQLKLGSQKNVGKCCTCTHYPKHIAGEAQPCKFKKAYVARKCDACSDYKCKFG